MSEQSTNFTNGLVKSDTIKIGEGANLDFKYRISVSYSFDHLNTFIFNITDKDTTISLNLLLKR